MTITNTVLGPNTRQVTLMNEVSHAGVMAAVSAALVAQGWTAYDTTSSYGQFTAVFSCLNKDAVTIKYMILRWNTVRCEIYTSCCESWNTTTKAATNESFTFYNCCPIPYHLTATDIVVMASSRWAILMTYIRNEPSQWAGVVEVEREAPEDTAAAGFPCFGWVSSNLWHLWSGTGSTHLSSQFPLICMPRTRNGSTGAAAAKNWSMVTPLVAIPSANLPVASSTPLSYYLGSAANAPRYQTYGWDTNKKIVHPIRPQHAFNTPTPANYGRMYGIKLIPQIGELMNKVQLPVDDDSLYSEAGALTDHWVLNLHAKSGADAYFALNSSWTNASVGTTTSPVSACATGAAYYVCNATQILKIDAGTFTSSVIAAVAASDIKYDGYRYVYAATSTGITRIDTQSSDAVTTLALAGGVNVLHVNYAYVMAACRTVSVTPQLYQVDVSTFTSIRTITLNYTLATGQAVCSITSDHSGNFYCTHPCGATVADGRVYKITEAGSVTNLAWTTAPAVGNFVNAGVACFDGATLYVGGFTSTAGYLGAVPIPAFGTIGTLVGWVITTASAGGNNRVDYTLVSGHILFQGKAASAGQQVSATAIPYPTPATVTGGLLPTPMSPATTPFFLESDGVRLLTNSSTSLTIYTGVYSRYPLSGVYLGQVLFPV